MTTFAAQRTQRLSPAAKDLATRCRAIEPSFRASWEGHVVRAVHTSAGAPRTGEIPTSPGVGRQAVELQVLKACVEALQVQM